MKDKTSLEKLKKSNSEFSEMFDEFHGRPVSGSDGRHTPGILMDLIYRLNSLRKVLNHKEYKDIYAIHGLDYFYSNYFISGYSQLIIDVVDLVRNDKRGANSLKKYKNIFKKVETELLSTCKINKEELKNLFLDMDTRLKLIEDKIENKNLLNVRHSLLAHSEGKVIYSGQSRYNIYNDIPFKIFEEIVDDIKDYINLPVAECFDHGFATFTKNIKDLPIGEKSERFVDLILNGWAFEKVMRNLKHEKNYGLSEDMKKSARSHYTDRDKGVETNIKELINEEPKLTLIRTNLRRYTFESPKIKQWVEDRSGGKVLNLFAGKTKLNLDEVRNDIDETMLADYNKDALDFVRGWEGEKFDTIMLDPPYSYRKSMEMYKGNLNSRFKLIADEIPRILNEDGVVISFGYHSTFMGNTRKFRLKELCVFAHGGAQHCTIGIIEERDV